MDAQTALLRIAQGGLANVAQHAAATRVRVVLTAAGHAVRLTVADDGRGFDPDAPDARGGGTDSFGLRAMRERVDQLDGTIEVTSAPARGTTVAVTLPRRGTR
jgi:signal transduction histidine kinase